MKHVHCGSPVMQATLPDSDKTGTLSLDVWLLISSNERSTRKESLKWSMITVYSVKRRYFPWISCNIIIIDVYFLYPAIHGSTSETSWNRR